MKIEEIRVGNYFIDTTFVTNPKIKQITVDDLLTIIKDVKNGFPIQLKYVKLEEYWFTHFGFEFESYPDSYVKKDVIIRKNYLDDYMFNLTFKIEYVHQLQNLFFSLKNQDLTKKKQSSWF
jgi:hypothetical protein